MTLKDVDEIASSPPGAVQDAVSRKIKEEIKEIQSGSAPTPIASQTTGESSPVRYATIRNGKAEFEKP